jgi:hypothetical protein
LFFNIDIAGDILPETLILLKLLLSIDERRLVLFKFTTLLLNLICEYVNDLRDLTFFLAPIGLALRRLTLVT